MDGVDSDREAVRMRPVTICFGVCENRVDGSSVLGRDAHMYVSDAPILVSIDFTDSFGDAV
jgi:hypothetical protein